MSDRTLLCVDDEVNVLSSLKRLLRKEDYRLMTAANGQEGLDLLGQHEVQVVLSDQRMPEMQGTEFLQKVREAYPDTVRIVLSGYAEVYTILESINQGGIYRFMPKPWSDEELKVTIRQCFERYDLLRQNRALVEQTQQQNERLRQLNERLERMVQERTQSLRFSQDVLEALPYPVIGISREGFAALANEAARELLAPTGLFLGADMSDFLPEDVTRAVQVCFGGGDLSRPCLDLEGQLLSSRIIPLHDSRGVRGCILVLEPESYSAA